MRPSIFKRIFSRKMLTRLVFTVVVLITLAMVFYRVEAWRGERAWETYRKSAEARGVKLWLKDFVAPPIPDEQNYAAIPFFSDSFGTGEQMAAALELLPQWRMEGYKPKRPTSGNLATGAVADVGAWRDYLVAAKMVPSPTDSAAQDIIAAFEKLAVLDQIRAASARPGCRFPVDIEKGFSTPLPHYAAMQRASEYFAVSAIARIAAKDSKGALADCMQMFRLCDALRDEPYLISLLVQFSFLEKVHLVVHAGLSAGLWKSEELTALESKLGSQNLIARFRSAMAVERAGMTTEIDRLSRAPSHEIREMLGLLGGMNGEDPPNYLAVYLYPRGWMHHCKVKANELHDAFLADYAPVNGVEPDFNTRDSREGPFRQAQAPSSFDRFRYAIVVVLMPALENVEKSLFHAQAHLTQARIACALEHARLKVGAFPESLDAVAPHFGPTIPKDFCDGKPMRYRRTADGYELWSVALNRVDEGGTHLTKEDDRKKQPDWLWKLVLNTNSTGK